MSDQNPLLPAIAPASGGALTTSTGQQRIATRMAENLLDVARSQERSLAAQRRYRIGDYEFREADHAQIQRWARRLGMAPEEVVARLGSSRTASRFDDDNFSVRDGAIVSLVWDFSLLPLPDWDGGGDLQIARLGVLKAPRGQLPALPECLHELICDDNQLTSLTLAQVPKLKKLHCTNNELTTLDLTPVAGLQQLSCRSNRLTGLDLTPVPGLQLLDCSSNQLIVLDLTLVAGLRKLYCYRNRLTELDLISVPRLQKLHCWNNQLTELELTPVPGLQELNCSFNQLTELELIPVPRLQKLYCSFNQLTELELIHMPRLQTLYCSRNPMTDLNLAPVPGLQKLWCDSSLNITDAPPNLEVKRS